MNAPMPPGPETFDSDAAALLEKIVQRKATVGIIGLGYVGLPLVQAFWAEGFNVCGFDTDPEKIKKLKAGESYIRHIPSERVARLNASDRFTASDDFNGLSDVDAMLICVPTPLKAGQQPDMQYVTDTAEAIATRLRPTQLVILESTTYPGTTVGEIQPILERGGLRSRKDFYLAYSPEREDPGNPDFGTAGIPKVVGGDGSTALQLAKALYDQVVIATVPVSNTETAEAVKLTENIFRAINIALVNELKQVYEAMGIDVWEVIDAARTKPFGFMPFYPGPGLGGHCIPIDPFYLSWRAREFGQETRLIGLAGEINTAMPGYVVDRLKKALKDRSGLDLKGARILLVGLAYKKNVDDLRESPALTLIELLEAEGAEVDYHDPYIPEIMRTREHPELAGRRSVDWTADVLSGYAAALISTDHDSVDYGLLLDSVPLVVDSRNVIARKSLQSDRVVKA